MLRAVTITAHTLILSRWMKQVAPTTKGGTDNQITCVTLFKFVT